MERRRYDAGHGVAMPLQSVPLQVPSLVCQRMRPLAAALAAVLACGVSCTAAASAYAPSSALLPHTALAVGNCNDSGSGSLRDAVNHAADGDTIDLTQLSCSVISLSTGAIVIGAQDLTLHGPGADALSIDSAGQPGNGVLYDLAAGTLKVQDMSVSFGRKYGDSGAAHGGCIFSLGNVELDNVHVYACTTHSSGSNVGMGGAIYAQGNVMLVNSVVEQSGVTTSSGEGKGGCVFAGASLTVAYSTISGCRVASSNGQGGGAYAGGSVFAKYSTISDNLVDETPLSSGGGLHANAGTSILFSTISGNHAHVGGGLYLGQGAAGDTAQIVESTISGNTAAAAGGLVANLPFSMYSSTVAFNTIPFQSTGTIGYQQSAGMGLRASPARIESSIIAGNMALGTPDVARDVGGKFAVTVSGSNNLINHIAQTTRPTDTINADPLLGPLRNNGGSTATHALLPGSPAIDFGNNARNLTTDQRGAGFARVIGNVADIGAYETDPDRIFTNGFD